MFASKTPRDLNHDPAPWRVVGMRTRTQHAIGSDDEWGTRVRDPRPEYDHPQHNEPNPILVKFREIPADSKESWRTGFLAAAERVRFAAWDDAQVEHGRKVLARLIYDGSN